MYLMFTERAKILGRFKQSYFQSYIFLKFQIDRLKDRNWCFANLDTSAKFVLNIQYLPSYYFYYCISHWMNLPLTNISYFAY